VKQNQLIKSSIVLLVTIFITGCSQKSPEATTQNFELSNIKVSQDQNSTDQNIATPTVSVTTIPKGKTMKTIEDFAPIDASGVIMHTSKGDISIELFREKAPLTTLNFLTLAKEGFYDGIVFHRIIAGFMAQVGDPLTKDSSQQALWGTGGPGYTIADEFGEGLKHDQAGIVSMANAGPNTGGSQIFITYGPQPHLDGVHAVFGRVTAGLDVAETLKVGDQITSVELIN